MSGPARRHCAVCGRRLHPDQPHGVCGFCRRSADHGNGTGPRPADLAERLAEYARRAERGRPLFGDGG